MLHSCTCVSLVTDLSCTLDHSSNAFALAQWRVTKQSSILRWQWSVDERHRKWSRLGGPRHPQHQQQQSHNVAASMYGHHRRFDDVAAADQTGDWGLLAASSSRHAHSNQWQTGCNQQHISSAVQMISAGPAETESAI